MSKPRVPLLLRIEDNGSGSFRDVEFNQPVVKIGKLSSVHLRLDDPSVNRIHAIIEITGPGEAKIIDMGSSKGTKVNGKRIYKSQLQSGDEILIGNTRLFIFIGPEEIARAKNGGNGAGAVGMESAPPPPADSAGTQVAPPAPAPVETPPPPQPEGSPFAGFEKNEGGQVAEDDGLGEEEESTQIVKNPLQPNQFEHSETAVAEQPQPPAPQEPHGASGAEQFQPPPPAPEPQFQPAESVQQPAQPQPEPPQPSYQEVSPPSTQQHQYSQSPEYPSQQPQQPQQSVQEPAPAYHSTGGEQLYSQQVASPAGEAYSANVQAQAYGQQPSQGGFQTNAQPETYSQPPASAGYSAPSQADPYHQAPQPSQMNQGMYSQGHQNNSYAQPMGSPQYHSTGQYPAEQMAGGQFQAQQAQFQSPQYGSVPPQSVPGGMSQFAGSPGMAGGMGMAQAQQPAYPPTPAPVAPPPPPSIAMVDANISETQEVLEVKVWWKDTILDHSHFYEPKKITIGESKKNTFSLSVSAIPESIDSFPLIEVEDDRVLINFTPQMSGEIVTKDNNVIYLNQILNTERVRRTEYGYQFPLPADAKVFLRMDEIVFEISFVPAPKKIPPFLTRQFDQSLARAIGASFLIHGLLLLMMLFADETPQDLEEDFFKQNNRFAQLIIRPEEPEEKKKKRRQSGGARAKGKKGKMGKPNATSTGRRAGQKEKNPDGTAPINIDKNIQKEILDKISKKGMLGILAGGGGSRAGGIITAKGIGGDDADGLGWHTGVKVGDALGSGGLGEGGLGSGGGGFSGAAAGLGSVGTYGIGGGKGGRGWGRSRLRKKRKRKLTISTGPPTVYGGLDKEIIRRIIHQHRSRFRYCYEKELIKNPNLQGKVYVKFIIEPNGRVFKSHVSRTTINNDRLEECLVRRIRLLRFPPPKGGGIVEVNYPFIFKPS